MSQFIKLVDPIKNKVKRIKRYNTENDQVVGYWTTPKDTWLIICNLWPLLKSDLSVNVGPRAKYAKLHPWGATRGGIAKVKNGRVKIDALPWETFIYRVQKVNQPAPKKKTK